MEVLSKQSALLSNYEVYALLKESQKGTKKTTGHLHSLATVVYETLKYLESTSSKMQSPEIIEDFLKKIQHLRLTKTEKLQLLNLRPTTGVELQLLIPEINERFSKLETEEIMAAVENLPALPTDVNMEEPSDNQQT